MPLKLTAVRWPVLVVVLVVAVAASLPSGSDPIAAGHADRDPTEGAVEVERFDLDVALNDAIFGRSGVIRTGLARPAARVALPLDWGSGRPDRVEYRWLPVLGAAGPAMSGAVAGEAFARAPDRPGVYELEIRADAAVRRFGDAYRLIVMVPFDRKRNGYIGRYFLGDWPTEGRGRTDRYAPPAGFIEVTPENQALRLSANFQLRQFLTKDQDDVWPKYAVVDPRLIDKLELVMIELNAMGVRAERMAVMSGFRTPQYNGRGLNRGRASLSRHQFGDAADVWIDNNGNWYMDDLNGDGRRDTGDARVMLRAVDRVEARHPDLVGGAGIYAANAVRGPFIHIDVRGGRARW